MFEQSQFAAIGSQRHAESASAILQLLAQSRARCEESYRLDRSHRSGPSLLTPGELRTVAEPLELLVRVARPELEALLTKLAPASYVVVLSDANGVAVDFVASGTPDKKLWRMGVCAGAVWGEPHVGTNGIGTSITTRSPILVHQRNHFLLKYAELTCTAAPLFDAQGRVIATLDASSVANLPQELQWLVLDLVVQTARRIERLYFKERYRAATVLTVDQGAGELQPKPVFMLALGEDGCVIDVQGNTEDGSDAPTLDAFRSRNFEAVFKAMRDAPAVPVSPTHVEHKAVVTLPGDCGPCFTVMHAPNRRESRVYGLGSPQEFQPISLPRRKAPAQPVLNLERLAGVDPALCKIIGQIKALTAHRLPFLIQGESGTGKEEFARAVHMQGPRAAGPFVAIDCSSIPENLVESELFGYEPGTFTGGRKEGRRGRLLEANGGTLLLDEIGDMPLQLQTRLLRVLAQNEVVPLGGHSPVKVDFNLVCATHQDLKKLIAQGRFRQDLYFRIAGCCIELPPLRSRAGKEEIIGGALEMECHLAGITTTPGITPDALGLLLSHSWPGNLRQLRLVLRYALAISNGACIDRCHLPADIVDGPQNASPAAALNERQLGDLGEALIRNSWCVSRTAREFGVSRQTIHRWMNARKIRRPVA